MYTLSSMMINRTSFLSWVFFCSISILSSTYLWASAATPTPVPQQPQQLTPADVDELFKVLNSMSPEELKALDDELKKNLSPEEIKELEEVGRNVLREMGVDIDAMEQQAMAEAAAQKPLSTDAAVPAPLTSPDTLKPALNDQQKNDVSKILATLKTHLESLRQKIAASRIPHAPWHADIDDLVFYITRLDTERHRNELTNTQWSRLYTLLATLARELATLEPRFIAFGAMQSLIDDDPYFILGVSPQAPQEDIANAFKKLSNIYDQKTLKKQYEKSGLKKKDIKRALKEHALTFDLIRDAYDKIKDPKSRQQFDREFEAANHTEHPLDETYEILRALAQLIMQLGYDTIIDIQSFLNAYEPEAITEKAKHDQDYAARLKEQAERAKKDAASGVRTPIFQKQYETDIIRPAKVRSPWDDYYDRYSPYYDPYGNYTGSRDRHYDSGFGSSQRGDGGSSGAPEKAEKEAAEKARHEKVEKEKVEKEKKEKEQKIIKRAQEKEKSLAELFARSETALKMLAHDLDDVAFRTALDLCIDELYKGTPRLRGSLEIDDAEREGLAQTASKDLIAQLIESKPDLEQLLDDDDGILIPLAQRLAKTLSREIRDKYAARWIALMEQTVPQITALQQKLHLHVNVKEEAQDTLKRAVIVGTQGDPHVLMTLNHELVRILKILQRISDSFEKNTLWKRLASPEESDSRSVQTEELPELEKEDAKPEPGEETRPEDELREKRAATRAQAEAAEPEYEGIGDLFADNHPRVVTVEQAEEGTPQQALGKLRKRKKRGFALNDQPADDKPTDDKKKNDRDALDTAADALAASIKRKLKPIKVKDG